MEKILSVSVASYNIEKYIRQCLDSFVCPDMIDGIEVLVVVDGATDNTLAIAREYEKKYPSIFRVIDKENGGWGSTVNVALSAATGKYFRLLDGDDYYINANLQEYIDFLHSCTTDIVQTPYIEFEDITNLVCKTTAFSEPMMPNAIYKLADVQEQLLVAMHSCTFRTDLLRKNDIHITEKCFYTDIEYTLKCMNISQTVSFWDKPIYMYRVGRENQSVSFNSLKKHCEEHLKVLDGLLEYEQTKLQKPNLPFYQERLKEMVLVQYSIFMSLDPNAAILRDLKKFDLKIKNDFPHYNLFRRKKMDLIRELNYHGINLVFILSRFVNRITQGQRF